MPAITTTVNNYYTTGTTSLSTYNAIAAAFAAITATNTNITLYQSTSASSLVYAITNPIGSGSYNTVYLTIKLAQIDNYQRFDSIAISETWNTGTSSGTNSGTIAASLNWTPGSTISYSTYTDNTSYGIITLYNPTFTSVLTFGYIATTSNNAFQSENIMPSIQAIFNNGAITPTTRTSQGATGNAQYTYSLGSASLPVYNATPVIAYPLSIQGLGLSSTDIGFRTASASFNDTYTSGSQVWKYISPTASTQGFYVRIT